MNEIDDRAGRAGLAQDRSSARAPASAGHAPRTIGLVIPHITHSSFDDPVRGMTDVLAGEGYGLLLGLSGDSPQAEFAQVAALLEQRVSGLSLTGSIRDSRTREAIRQAGIPVVETSTLKGPCNDMVVGFSNEAAACAMVRHLAGCGYRKIGLISPAAINDDRSADRQAGYRQAIEALDLASDPGLIVESGIDLAAGARAFLELVGAHPDVEAIFCTSDVLAVGAMLEAVRCGIRVPGDLGIAGFDDLELAQQFVPALTTVRLRRYEIGRVSARLLLQRIRGETPEQAVVDLGFEIMPRDSTRRTPA